MSKTLESQLDLVEQQFNEVSALLASGDAVDLERASAGLQALSVELIQSLGGSGRVPTVSRALAQRLRNLGQGMASLRVNLARRQAQVQQAMRILVPAAAPTTYGHAAGPYGQAMQNSGAFTVLKA